jgi:hypothetical protein
MAGRFSWIPDYVMSESAGHKTEILTYESGKEKRLKKHGSIRRTWNLSFPCITLEQVNSMQDFFESQEGQHLTFEWINPLDNILYTVRFAEDGFRSGRRADDVYDVALTFMEIV